MRSVLAKLNCLRRWVDRDESASASIPSNHPAEQFLLRVASEIARTLEAETFTPPGCAPIIPYEFIVFLSLDDDREWRGLKRRGFEQGMAQTLRGKAFEIFRGKPLLAPGFAVELRVDGTLDKGQFRVKASWDEETDRTQITARFNNAATLCSSSDSIEDITLVSTRPRAVLYPIEVWRDGTKQALIGATKTEFAIGRGSSSVPVDLQLRGDAEISRLHLVLARDVEGRIWLTPKGQNPVFVNDREVRRGDRVLIEPGTSFKVCSYYLRIQETVSARANS